MKETTKGTSWGLALLGLNVFEVRVTAHAAPCGSEAPSLTIHGLGSEARARETRVRLRYALGWDAHRVSVNVEALPEAADAAPLDLAIAVAILRALESSPVLARMGAAKQEPVAASEATAFVGELCLDGTLQPVRGLLAMIEETGHTIDVTMRGGPLLLVVPEANRREAEISSRPGEIRTVRRVTDLFAESTMGRLVPYDLAALPRETAKHPDLSGSHREVLEVARACPRMLLVGRPGSGKTAIARRLLDGASLDAADVRMVAQIHGAAGLQNDRLLAPPFRAPHYTVSETGLVGGGARPRPGEVSLAHRGVLMLDELCEFKSSSIEALGGVLRAGVTRISRNDGYFEFPAVPRYVVAAANPCACGYGGSSPRRCTCPPEVLRRHEERLRRYADRLGISKRLDVPEVML